MNTEARKTFLLGLLSTHKRKIFAKENYKVGIKAFAYVKLFFFLEWIFAADGEEYRELTAAVTKKN
jgi:hypothetical protein